MGDIQKPSASIDGEWYSAIFGLLGGALSGAICAWFLAPDPVIWIASIVAALCGLVGGALGQNLIEGVVAAVICLILLVLISTTTLPGNESYFWWLRELGIGWSVGSGIGWLAHGIQEQFFQGQHG